MARLSLELHLKDKEVKRLKAERRDQFCHYADRVITEAVANEMLQGPNATSWKIAPRRTLCEDFEESVWGEILLLHCAKLTRVTENGRPYYYARFVPATNFVRAYLTWSRDPIPADPWSRDPIPSTCCLIC